jgi:hypothetical protein
MLRGIVLPKTDEIIAGWRTLHNEELRNLYSSSHLIRMIKSEKDELAGECGTHGREEECIQDFGTKS